MTLASFHSLAVWIALVVYLFLAAFMVAAWARQLSGRIALIATLVTALHLCARALTGLSLVTDVLHTLALLAWIGLLAHTIGLSRQRLRDPTLLIANLTLVLAVLLAITSIAVTWSIAGVAVPEPGRLAILSMTGLLLAVTGLVFVEQVASNTRQEQRTRTRYLTIGLGMLFAFQVLLNATVHLNSSAVQAMVAIEPLIYSFAAPCIIIATLRNRREGLQISLSRQLFFKVGTLIYTGLALLLLGLFGYLDRAFSGDWRLALVTLITIVVLMTVVIVFGSSRMRARGRQLILEHVFRGKYDYRDEWLRVTRLLTESDPDYDLYQQVIRSLARIALAEGGALWMTSEEGSLVLMRALATNWNSPLSAPTGEALQQLFSAREETLDLRTHAARGLLTESTELAAFKDLRFITPLMSDARLIGVVGLRNPPVPVTLDREDHDILKLIARESAGFVALQTAERALAESDQLHSFHKISAFIVHDVKTIAAQLSLLLRNAERHRDNPAFIDDMLKTVDNSVKRINRLLEQLQEGVQAGSESIDLDALLPVALRPYLNQCPALSADTTVGGDIKVHADPSRLIAAIGHLVQNAIDATATNDSSMQPAQVRVWLCRSERWGEIHVEDNGNGMAPEFVQHQLFRPFTSTKGVSGMGIGAYQARSYVRALGGDIEVTSEPGRGSHFIIRLPLQIAETT